MAIDIKSPKEIEAMRVVCRLAAATLLAVGDKIRPGMSTLEIDRLVHEHTISQGARPAPLHYRGFPKSVCTSVNDVVCHGIPDGYTLRNGDIVNVDVTHIYEGFHGDTSATFYIGTPSVDARHVVEVARRALDIGIAQVRGGARLGDIGGAIQEYVESEGCSVVRDFVGHGIGRKFHDAPQVKHYGKRGTGERLRAGMTFTIEPMVNLGAWEVNVDAQDKWTVRTNDGSLSAQFEHTVLVTPEGCDVLTARSHPLRGSENVSALFVA
ncbi:MAG: type I methionyl aminopeptidase [Myxococcota bacterium]|nr:type I methionyl aminopeptidase [Myxococcota bacterium]